MGAAVMLVAEYAIVSSHSMILNSGAQRLHLGNQYETEHKVSVKLAYLDTYLTKHQ